MTATHAEPSKSFLKSKRFWGIATAAAADALPTICNALGVDPNGQAIGTIHGVGIPVGLALALVGAFMAKKPLHLF